MANDIIKDPSQQLFRIVIDVDRSAYCAALAVKSICLIHCTSSGASIHDASVSTMDYWAR